MYSTSKRSSYPEYGTQSRPESLLLRQDTEVPSPSHWTKEEYDPRKSRHRKSAPLPTQLSKQSKLPANRESYPMYGSQGRPESLQRRMDVDLSSPPVRYREEYNTNVSYKSEPSPKLTQSAQAAKTLANRACYPGYEIEDRPETSRVDYSPEDHNRRASYDPMSLHSPTQAFQASQLPPGSIPYNTPIIIYASSGPPEETKSSSSSFTHRLKKAFAAVTENPDEAMLGCKPGKTNEEFKSKRAERLKEMADDELKYKNRPTIIKKWIARHPDEIEPPMRARERKEPSARQGRVEEGKRRSRDDAYSRK